jgi:predicted alpha/beta hydrolase
MINFISMKNEIGTENEIRQESIFIELNTIEKLHLKRIYAKENGPVVFMLHGSIENGRIFYSNSGKGFAPYLARNGYDVYIADIRGRGLSTPKINRDSLTGQTETITEEIPAFLNEIQKIRGNTPQHWIGHSWGGVLLASYFARYEKEHKLVKSMVFFATKKAITVFNSDKLIKINFFWNFFAFILTAIYGYLPATRYGYGSDNETKKSHRQTTEWVKNQPWVDTDDGFNYGQKIKEFPLPPLLSITGAADTYLGHPVDVNNFVKEAGNENSKFIIIGKENGNKHDYGHIDILTQPDALEDHFPMVLNWLKKHESEK